MILLIKKQSVQFYSPCWSIPISKQIVQSIHNIIMDKWMDIVVVSMGFDMCFGSISVYLSVLVTWENNYAILYFQAQHKCRYPRTSQVSNLLLDISTTIFNNILLNSIARFCETFLCLCSFQYIQQHLLENEFTNNERICMSQSMLVHSHLQTDCRVFLHHSHVHINKNNCCFYELEHASVSI